MNHCIEILHSANFLHPTSLNTLSDVTTPYSKQATPYTIGLWRTFYFSPPLCFESIVCPFSAPFPKTVHACTLAKKKLNGSGHYPLMGLQHQVPWELKREILFDYWAQPEQYLFYFYTSTLLRNPLNRHSLGSFNFFYQSVALCSRCISALNVLTGQVLTGVSF